jgi:hypothetical protein
MEPTAEDMRKFQCHVNYWAEKLGMHSYAIEVIHDTMSDHVGAWTEMHHVERQLIIGISYYNTSYSLAYLARHEMFEALCEPLYKLSDSVVNGNVAQTSGHEIVFRLEKVLPLPTDKEVGYEPPKPKRVKDGKKSKRASGSKTRGKTRSSKEVRRATYSSR